MGRVDIYPSSVLQLPPSAQIGYAEDTSTIGSITTTDVDLVSVTVTVPIGRRIRVSGAAVLASGTATDNIRLMIKEGAAVLALNDLVTNGAGYRFFNDIILTPTAGTHTYKIAAVRASGSGTITSYGGSGPTHILVEDITGAFLNSNLVTSRVLRTVIDGGGSAITTGAKKVYISVPNTCTITKMRLLADVSGSIVLDLWKDTFANYPPTVADTIVASAKPTLSSAIKVEDTTLTGWTTALAAGDIIEVNVDSATTVTKVYMDLFVV